MGRANVIIAAYLVVFAVVFYGTQIVLRWTWSRALAREKKSLP